MADKIITALFITLIAGAVVWAHINQSLRMESAVQHEQMLDDAGVVGWVEMDPVTMQLYFVARK